LTAPLHRHYTATPQSAYERGALSECTTPPLKRGGGVVRSFSQAARAGGVFSAPEMSRESVVDVVRAFNAGVQGSVMITENAA